MNRFDRFLLILLGGYVLLLAILPFILTPEMFRWTFSETGPFEQLSIIAWLLAAAAVAVKIRPYHFPAAVFTVVYLLFAAREADLHKAFTTRSISKLNYYRDATIPYSERIVAALVAIIILCVILYWLITVLRFLFIERGLHTRAGRWLAIGAGLLVLAKMLDRSEAVLTQILHMVRPEWIVGLSDSFEEGLELATPVLLTVSAWISQSDGRYLHPKKSAKQRRP